MRLQTHLGAIWGASGTTLASIWVPRAVPGAAWKWSGLGRGSQLLRPCPGEANNATPRGILQATNNQLATGCKALRL